VAVWLSGQFVTHLSQQTTPSPVSSRIGDHVRVSTLSNRIQNYLDINSQPLTGLRLTQPLLTVGKMSTGDVLETTRKVNSKFCIVLLPELQAF